jgi:hypothetical protein
MIRQIDSEQWGAHLDQVSKSLQNRKFSIEIVGMDIGSQIQLDSSTFSSMAYDPKDDIVEVYSEEYEHYIRSPSAIYFSAEQGQIDSIEVVDGDDRKQILSFEKQVLLSREEDKPD